MIATIFGKKAVFRAGLAAPWPRTSRKRGACPPRDPATPESGVSRRVAIVTPPPPPARAGGSAADTGLAAAPTGDPPGSVEMPPPSAADSSGEPECYVRDVQQALARLPHAPPSPNR